MPTIEITAEQAQALASGENITIAPAPPTPVEDTFLVILVASGKVFEARGYIRPDGRLAASSWRVVRYGRHSSGRYSLGSRPHTWRPSENCVFVKVGA